MINQGYSADVLVSHVGVFPAECGWMLHDSAEKAFVFECRANRLLANGAFLPTVFCGYNAPSQRPEVIDTHVRVVLFRMGIKNRAQGEKAALTALKKRYDDAATQTADLVNAAIGRLDDQKNQFDTDQALRAQYVDDLREAVAAEWQGVVDAAKAHEVAVRQRYERDMAVKAGADYWGSKRDQHQTSARAIAKLGCIVGVIFGIVMVTLFVFLRMNAGTNADSVWHYDLALALLLGTLGIWAIRLLVKVFLSHLHLANDAAERVTMVMTYQALLHGEKPPEDTVLTPVLAAIFRAANDGMVKDDGMSPGLFDVLTRMPSKN